MVQEVHGGFDAYSAMMRHNPPYGNMHNIGGYNPAFSGTSQTQPMGQYGAPDYASYHGGNNLQGAGDASSWSPMYPSTSVSPPTSSSRHTNLLDHEWPQTQYVGNVTVQPHETHMHHLGHVGAGTGSATPTGSGSGGNGGNSTYTSYRGSGCLPTMPTEYGPTSSSGGHTSGMTPTMTPSPTPGGVVMGGSPPGGSGGNANRQTNRAPYDWMKKVAYPSTPSTELGSVGKGISSKTRTKDKYRVVYTDHQRLELEKEFHYSRYITIRRKAELAQNLALSERQVKIWFQNRRAKERKQNKKRDEAMGIKTERPDSLPLMSPLGGVCDGGPQQNQGHCGSSQGQQMTLNGAMVAPVVGGGCATPDMGGLHGAVGGPHPCHTPPMTTHSPPMAGHHS